MTFEEHCKQCEEILGNPFPEVHKWLDFYYGKFPLWDRHRQMRHHLQGITEIEKLYGHKAAKAAYLHVISDLSMDNWKPEMGTPKDRDDYVKMGLW